MVEQSGRLSVAMIAVLLSCCAVPAYSQKNPWSVGIHTKGSHFLVGNAMEYAGSLVNILIAKAMYNDMSLAEYSLGDVHYLRMTDNGERIAYHMANPYGYKAYDLFNGIETGIKVGWHGVESPVGIYLYGAYGFDQYKLRFLGEEDYSKHKLHSLKVGVGIRVSPLHYLLDEYDWCPIFELGSVYVNNFAYDGPYGGDKAQINNGLRTSYAIGVQLGNKGSVAFCMDMAHYDMFNRNYTPDGGFWYPYANFKSNDMNFSLRLTYNVFGD